jgi:radical SAM modification target selenobiotic family peptide
LAGESQDKEAIMDQERMKKLLAGLSIAGLLGGAALPACSQAGSS